jgi:hypothetical protein
LTQDNIITSRLIDPSLHCLVYGHTLVCDTRHPEGLRPQPAPSHLGSYFVSQKFVFLPTDFSISALGHVRFLSYINNIDPKDTTLYCDMEKLLESCVPLFSHVLTDLHRNNPLPQRIQGYCRYTEWDEPEPPEHSDDEDGWSTYERDVQHWVIVSFFPLSKLLPAFLIFLSLILTQHRPIELPDVPANGYPGGIESRKYTVDLYGRTLQVIVDVSEIRLVGLISMI